MFFFCLFLRRKDSLHDDLPSWCIMSYYVLHGSDTRNFWVRVLSEILMFEYGQQTSALVFIESMINNFVGCFFLRCCWCIGDFYLLIFELFRCLLLQPVNIVMLSLWISSWLCLSCVFLSHSHTFISVVLLQAADSGVCHVKRIFALCSYHFLILCFVPEYITVGRGLSFLGIHLSFLR